MLVLWLLLAGSAQARDGHVAQSASRTADYKVLYETGVLRAGPQAERYRNQLVGNGRNGAKLIKRSSTNFQRLFAPGTRLTVNFGEGIGQIDHQAEVIEFDEVHQRVKVRALERTPTGLRRTEGWHALGELIYGTAKESWPDGTRVLGGPPGGSAAVMVIDRAHDVHLKRFMTEQIRPLGEAYQGDPLALVDTVVQKVRSSLDYNIDTDHNTGGGEILVGDYLEAGAGVCRNYAALTKVVLDELKVPGLEVRYVTGRANDSKGFSRGLHAWIEVTLPNGRRYGVDPTWVPKVENLGKVTYAGTFQTLGEGGLAPIGQFYADRKHVPTYVNRVLHPGEPLDADQIQVPTDPAPLLLREKRYDPKSTYTRSEYLPAQAPAAAGFRIADGALQPGRRFVWRFDDQLLAVDPKAEILEVDAAQSRVKIRALERVVKHTLGEDGKPKDATVTSRQERWVPIAALRSSLETVELSKGAQVPLASGKLLAVDPQRDARLTAFLEREIAPIAASGAPVQRKIARALGRVRQRVGAQEIDPDQAHASLGEMLEANRVAEKPFAAAALVAIHALGIPGIEIRYVHGAAIDRDLREHGPDAWLEVSYPEKGAIQRFGVDARAGTIEPIGRFYNSFRRAPRAEAPAEGRTE